MHMLGRVIARSFLLWCLCFFFFFFAPGSVLVFAWFAMRFCLSHFPTSCLRVRLSCCGNRSLFAPLQVARYLTKLDVFALLVSGLCHDIEHQGLSNLFHVRVTLSWLLMRHWDGCWRIQEGCSLPNHEWSFPA